jgi:hypothetical protein
MNNLKALLVGVLLASPWACWAQESEEAGEDTTATAIPGMTYQEEMLVVRAILDSNGFGDISASAVATEDPKTGRMVKLDLANKEIAKDGLKRLPASIGQLSALRSLSLADNSLASIPSEIGNLTELRELDISNNDLTSVPPSIGNLANLQKLDLRNNEIESLPVELYNLKNLWYLQLWGNELTALSEALGNLTSLKEIYLKGNKLIMLPNAITKMPSLTYYDIQLNSLCKVTPQVEAWLRKKDKRYHEAQKCW